MSHAANDKEPSDGESNRQDLPLWLWVRVRPGASPDQNSQGLAPVFSRISGLLPSPQASGASGAQENYSLCLIKFLLGVGVGGALGREPSYPGSISLLWGALTSHADQLFWKFVCYLCCFSLPSVKNVTDFKPLKAKPLLRSLRSSHGKQENNALHLWLEEKGLFCEQNQSSLALVSSAIVYCNTHSDFFLSFHLMSSGLLTSNTYTCSQVYKTQMELASFKSNGISRNKYKCILLGLLL